MIIFSSAKDTPSSLSHAKIVSEWHMGQHGDLTFSLRFRTCCACFACCAELPSIASAFLLPLDVPMRGTAGLLGSSAATEPALLPRLIPLPALPPLPRSSAAASCISSCSPAALMQLLQHFLDICSSAAESTATLQKLLSKLKTHCELCGHGQCCNVQQSGPRHLLLCLLDNDQVLPVGICTSHQVAQKVLQITFSNFYNKARTAERNPKHLLCCL